MERLSTKALRWLAAISVAAAMFAAGCANEPAAPAPAPSPAAVAPTPPGGAPPRPAPAAPELPPAQAKAQAQKLALEAVDQLQNGDEASARQTLTNATVLDPTNDLARKMSEQITADAQRELGTTFFRYTVQPADSLSKLAQQYLGDRFRFYILARYNDMPNPSRLAAGQVIKIPGKAPPVIATPARPPETAESAPAAPAAADAGATPAGEAVALLQKGRRLQASGDLQGAYGAFSDAVARAPGNRDAVTQRDAAKVALLRSYDREATQAFQRQNLDLAISKWDRILELDPGNQKARLERDRAIDLKKRMTEKFGTTTTN